MARDQKDLLERAIRQARTFDADERSPYSLEMVMIWLNEADQSKNKGLWQAFRAALAGNSQLMRKAPKEFFTRLYFAKDGYWWWDPSQWTVSSSSKQA